MQDQEEQLRTRGDQAEQLLGSEAFNDVINGLVESTFQTFVNSSVSDNEARDNAYRHYRALVDVVNTLKQRVSIRDEIVAKYEINNDDTSQENE